MLHHDPSRLDLLLLNPLILHALFWDRHALKVQISVNTVYYIAYVK